MPDSHTSVPRKDASSSIVKLAQALVRIPSRGGIDDYTAVVQTLEMWLSSHRMSPTRLVDADGKLVGVMTEIEGARPGPTYVLDATVDTALFGDPASWTHGPVSGDIEDGWLYGRGAADSKTGVAIFAHLGARLASAKDRLAGRTILLFDGDEHSGSFNGAVTFFERILAGRKVDALMIGYPGPERIVVGGRGFIRFVISVHGQAAHSGSSHPAASNAVTKAGRVISQLAALDGRLADRRMDGFDVPPKVTVTSVSGGEDFSLVPDLCRIGVDVRVTPAFGAEEAEVAIHEAVASQDREDPERPSVVETIKGWPPFRTPDTAHFVTTLQRAAEAALARPVPLEVVGPSNIGNYVAGLGIPAVAGFGAVYRNLHAADECIEVASVEPVYRAYMDTMFTLLGDTDRRPATLSRDVGGGEP
ncbi:MAG: M20 family metallopeptidase [Actinomycetota bacterium]